MARTEPSQRLIGMMSCVQLRAIPGQSPSPPRVRPPMIGSPVSNTRPNARSSSSASAGTISRTVRPRCASSGIPFIAARRSFRRTIAQVPIEQGEARVRRPIERLQLGEIGRPLGLPLPRAGPLSLASCGRSRTSVSGPAASGAGKVGGRLASGRLPAARPMVLLRPRDRVFSPEEHMAGAGSRWSTERCPCCRRRHECT